MFLDQYKGFFEWRGNQPDQEPRYGIFYLIVAPVVAGIIFVAWLGWTWTALVLTILVTALVITMITVLAVRRHHREQSQIPEWR